MSTTIPSEPKQLIPKSDRIPMIQKLAFGAGNCMDSLSAGLAINILWMPFFNIGLGISPSRLGFVLMVFQVWNAFLDPVMGNISDNARTRWGRRRPFMVVGAVLTAAVWPLFWHPPTHWGETGILVFLIGLGIVFYTCFSCWAMPYYGLQLELTPSYDERTRLTAWMTFFGIIGGLLSGWALAIVAGPWFSDPLTGKADILRGVKTCSWVMAALILLIGLLPPLLVKERYYESETRHQPRISLLSSLRECFKCQPLWMLIGISFFVTVGCSAVGSLGQYVSIYYVCHGDLAAASVIAGWKSTACVVTGILCLPLYTWLGEKFDKKQVVGFMLLGSLFGHGLNYFCMTPAMPYLQIVPGCFESCAISALWLFLPSMKADVSDYDEYHTFKRREGALNAFYSWFIKAAIACGLGMGGLAMQLSGFNVKLDVQQPPEVLHSMLLIYVFLPLAIWAVGFLFVYLYPLNRQRMGVIRSALEERRGKI